MTKPSQRLVSSTTSVTIRDVAAQAGVSVATVSRVLNRTGPVRESTCQRVTEIAAALDYVPHAGARSLSMRATNTVGVLLPELHGEFFSEVIRGIDAGAREHSFHLLVSGSHSDREEMRAMLQAVRGRVDGLIVMSPDLEPNALVADLPPGMPVVMLNSAVAGRPSVIIDNVGAARGVVRHLLSLGHTRIGFICGPSQNADAVQRRRGYRSALRAAGFDQDPELEASGNFSEESGYEAAKKLLSRAPRPTAMFASNDAMAIGALSAVREAGLKVPGEMALVGFDDIPIARFLDPPLTTVRVPMAEIGRRGFELLFQTADPSSSRPVNVETELIVRRSSGASIVESIRRK